MNLNEKRWIKSHNPWRYYVMMYLFNGLVCFPHALVTLVVLFLIT